MNNLYTGIIIGLFLYFAGERFVKVAIKAWKQRKVDMLKNKEEEMEEIVEKVAKKIQENGR